MLKNRYRGWCCACWLGSLLRLAGCLAAANAGALPALAPPAATAAPAALAPPAAVAGETALADFSFVEPAFENVGDADSIPANIVMALAQDAMGLIWIGTQGGLVRYDGYQLRKFVYDANNPRALSGDFINALAAAPDGRLWIGSGSGLARFDPASEQFEPFQHDPKQADSIRPGGILALCSDASGGLWLATPDGLDYLPPASRRFVHYAQNAAGNRVHAILQDRQNRIWIGLDDGMRRLSPGQPQFGAITPAGPDALWLNGKLIQTLFQADDGKIWIGSDRHGAAWLDPDTLQLHPLQQGGDSNHPAIRSFAQPIPGQIWAATQSDGMHVLAASDGRLLRRIRHDASLASSLALDSIGAMLKDRSGMLWLGTWGGGLQRQNAGRQTVQTLRHSPGQPVGLSYSNVRSVLELADGRILVGTMGNGIDILDRQRGLIGAWRTPNGPRGIAAGNGPPLPDGSIFAMAQTRDGTLWVCTQQSGLLRLSPGAAQWQALPGMQDVQCRTLYVARDGALWLAGKRALARWLPQQQQFRLYPAADGQPLQGFVFAFAEDALGNLWAASGNGLWLLAAGSTRLQAIHHDDQRADSLSSDLVAGLLLDQQQQLWITTDHGLDRLRQRDDKQARFEHVSALLGQSGKGIGSNLLQDRLGRIWSDQNMFDPNHLQLTPLSRADGYDIGTKWIGAFARTRDGLFLYGGTQGLAIIHPEQFQPLPFTAPLVVTGLKINGKAVPPGPLATTGNGQAGLTLSPHERNFSLEFAALDYANAQNHHYQYRLHDYDKDWIEADAEHRAASYGNLWPGQYTLQVRASNRRGEFSPHELRIALRVLPAFWQTGWFLLLALLLLNGSIYGLYRWRTRRLKALIAAGIADIASAHEKLAQSHDSLASAHDELVVAHRHLQDTQAQLIQSEKMAALGQLIANVAHEINTPLGAVKASGSNIADALNQTLIDLPKLARMLSAAEEDLLHQLLQTARAPCDVSSSREERALKKQIRGWLEQHDISNADAKAAILVQLHAQAELEAILPLLRHAEADFILHTADSIANIINNTSNINLAVARASKIVFALKAYSRSGQNGEMQQASLRDGLETVLTLYQHQIKQGVELVCEFDDIAPIDCLPDELNQVWTNLIQNALQAMAYHGTLSLRLYRDRDFAVVAVGDSGCGIAQAQQQQIFAAFFTTKPQGEGSGLGLHIVEKIIAKHQGKIEVQSQVGAGSTFLVWLPYHPPANAPNPP